MKNSYIVRNLARLSHYCVQFKMMKGVPKKGTTQLSYLRTVRLNNSICHLPNLIRLSFIVEKGCHNPKVLISEYITAKLCQILTMQERDKLPLDHLL